MKRRDLSLEMVPGITTPTESVGGIDPSHLTFESPRLPSALDADLTHGHRMRGTLSSGDRLPCEFGRDFRTQEPLEIETLRRRADRRA